MSRKTAVCSFCKQEKIIVARGWCGSCYGRDQKTGSPEYKRKGIRNICSEDDCNKFVVTHGLCDKHRKRLARHGHLEATRPNDWGDREKHPLYSVWVSQKRFRGTQLCSRWNKDFWSFVEDIKGRPSKSHYFRAIDEDAELNIDNWHWVEKVPSKTDEEKSYLKQWAREDRKNNPDKYRDKSLRKYYGIGLNEFNQMLKSQNGKCAICDQEEAAIDPRSKRPRQLAVDHCHKKGHVRGLLCSNCNLAIGNLKDSTELLRKAILYLERTK